MRGVAYLTTGSLPNSDVAIPSPANAPYPSVASAIRLQVRGATTRLERSQVFLSNWRPMVAPANSVASVAHARTTLGVTYNEPSSDVD
jgi:hypothetical protein